MKDQLIVTRMHYFTNVVVKLYQLQGSVSIAFSDMWWMKQIVINNMKCVEVSVWWWHGGRHVRTTINTDPIQRGWRDQGSGIRNQGSGIRDQGSGIRDQGSGIRDQGSGIRDLFGLLHDGGTGINLEPSTVYTAGMDALNSMYKATNCEVSGWRKRAIFVRFLRE